MDLKEHTSSTSCITLCKTSQRLASPKSQYPRQIPLRSLENTVAITCEIECSNMVCSESSEDMPSVQQQCFECTGTTSHQQCASSLEVTPHSQKSSFCSHTDSQIFPSFVRTPTNEDKMVRTTGGHHIQVDSIFQNGENMTVDKKCNSQSNGTSVRIRNEPFSDCYHTEEEIGRGKFAVVKRCRHKATGLKYAAKFLRKRRKGKDCRADVLKEIQMLEMAIIHPRLVDLREVFETSHELIVVTEYAEGGELFQHVVLEDNFDEEEVKRLMRQILEGVLFLHELNIVHLDIKPQNILLTGPVHKGNIKLCDLGFARPVNSGDDVRDIVGTPDYVAPEILSYEPICTSSDMWSVGVLTYVMLTGCSPFAGDTKQETFLNISQVNLDFPDDLFSGISSAAVDFMSKLMVLNPEERLSAGECFNHPWLQKTSNGSPAGQRRALTPPSPDTLAEEPLKKCRCESQSLSSSTLVLSDCSSVQEIDATVENGAQNTDIATKLDFDDTESVLLTESSTDGEIEYAVTEYEQSLEIIQNDDHQSPHSSNNITDVELPGTSELQSSSV